MLDVLAGTCMIQPSEPDRYSMHDLLRSHGRELAAGCDPGEARAKLTSLFDYYLHAASTAVDTLFPAQEHQRPRMPLARTPAPVLASAAAARAWLDGQRASLVAVVVHAAGHGWPAYATQLSALLFRYLEVGAHSAEAITFHSSAFRAAGSIGDRAAEANAMNSLSATDFQLGRYQKAASHLMQSAATYAEIGDQVGRARVLGNLSVVEVHQGHCRQAAGHLEQALAMLGDAGASAQEEV